MQVEERTVEPTPVTEDDTNELDNLDEHTNEHTYM